MLKLTKNQHLTYVTMLGALAIVLNLFESYFIPPIQFGIRFGIANIIALVTISLFSVKDLIVVNTLRVVIGGLLRGIIFGAPFWISAGGVILSTLVIILCHKAHCTLGFTSIMSAISHSLGQVGVVILLYQQVGIGALLPILALASIVTGCLTGFIAKECIKRIG